jgi:hypothetical protein
MVDKYGILVGGGSLAVLVVSTILAIYVTRGLILILVPITVFWFIGYEVIQYVLDKKYGRKD